MDRPLDIAFHNMDSSESLEAMIRAHVDRLDKRHGHLIGCRVSVEALHRQHQTGNVYECHITLSLRGRDLAVSRGPHRAKQHYANPDVRVSIREAFEAAERQLLGHKRHGRTDTTAPSGSALAGQVTLIEPGADHGFILNSTGSQLYFHRDSVTNGRFEDLKQGQLVYYVEEEGDAGPVATKVRVVERKSD
ncbi:MAG: HPF/RaiA family ribosome-associated protein [Acetobacteraceae bacterium]|nr:HPF/RaiA family ribosome-associated protein [Acetobacteraceae bacterium]